MNQNQLFNLLIEREHYNVAQAKVVAQALLSLDSRLQPLLEAWAKDSQNKGDYIYEQFSLEKFMQEKHRTYPAALIDMNWLLYKPEEAKKILQTI